MTSGKTSLLAQGESILDLIPQRPPVVMISSLLFANTEKVISGFIVHPDCIFNEDGFLSASGLVENIAQTAAAGVGYNCTQENKKVPVGFIASVKDLIIHDLPPVNAEHITEINVINQIMNVTIVSGKVHLNDKLLVECEMRIFVKPD